MSITKPKILLLVLFLYQSKLFPSGPYSVETISEQDGLRNGPDYSEALLYYSSDATTPLAVVVLITGFTNSISAIQNWVSYLASYGLTDCLTD